MCRSLFVVSLAAAVALVTGNATAQNTRPPELPSVTLSSAVVDTVGYIIGAYGYETKSGDVGKFTLTLRRRPGGPWLIVSDMDNVSRPL